MKHQGMKSRIVAVDDERDFLEFVRASLSPEFEVECFSSGDGLAEQLADLEPDLVILDVHMPGANGFEVCRRIRADNRLAFVPVLFLTASKQDVDFIKTLAVGANSYLNKPISSRELNFRAREILS